MHVHSHRNYEVDHSANVNWCSLASAAFWKTIAAIAVAALVTVVVLQVALPRLTQLRTQTVTVTVTQQTGSVASRAQTGSVLIKYNGEEWAPAGCPTLYGFSYLGVHIVVENHGYDRLYVQPSDFYVIINGQQFQYSPTTFSCYVQKQNELQPTYVFDRLSVEGYVFFELPDNWARGDNGPFGLFWDHPSNVQYVQYEHLP